jgi:hypothetical protein
MADKMWHWALDEAVEILRECEYDFEKAYELIDNGYEFGGGVKDVECSLMAQQILGLLEAWLDGNVEIKDS